MQRHEDTVTDSYGNITTSASITVNVHGGGAATVYSDNGITILAQPFTPVQDITSPQYGRFFFYAADGRYDINVSFSGKTYTDPDVLLQDPTTDLSASSGSSLIGFIPSGAGAVATTVQSKLRQTVNVKDFGAAGNGSTDDTTAIQSAITYAQTASYNNTATSLYFPCGNYKVTTGTLSITNSINLVGAGRDCTKISWTDTTGDLLTIATDNPVTIDDILFSGPGSYTAASGSAITVGGSSTANAHSRFSNLRFTGGYNQFTTTSAYVWVLDNCSFSSFVNHAVTVSNTNNVDAGDSSIINMLAANGGASAVSIYQVSSGGLKITNSKLNGGLNGYQMQLASAAATSDFLMSNTSIENMTGTAILFQSDGGGAIFANIALSNNQLSINANGISIASNGFGSVSLSGGVITSVTGTAVNIGGNTHDVFVGDLALAGSGGAALGVVVGASATNTTVALNKYHGFTTNITDSSGIATILDWPSSASFSTNVLNIGGLNISGTNSTVAQQAFIGGTNTNNIAAVLGLYVGPIMKGGAATTSMYGNYLQPTFVPNAGATISAEYGVVETIVHNSTVTPTIFVAYNSALNLGASSTGGTIAIAVNFNAVAPSFNASATTNITAYSQFLANDIVAGAGNAITSSYGFRSLVTSGTGKWGFLGGGSANNAWAGNSRFGGTTVPVATVDVTGSILTTTTITAGTGFGCNGQTAQTAYVSGGAAPAGGTGATAGAYDTAAHRDALITLVNNMRAALVANGIMS